MKRPTELAALIVHGGAGARGLADERRERRIAILEATRRGARILLSGASALDAVVAAVVVLEDHPLFNAGYGSLLNSDGMVEMDASVMVSMRPDEAHRAPGDRNLKANAAGAVAAVSRIRNPVLLARAVMERTPHVLMAGAGAERFAKSAGMKLCRPEDLITQRARRRWLARRSALENGPAIRDVKHGTVGAVAIDSRGNLAAATSTGGVPGKLAGRVGDSAIVGAGTFADLGGAASATGQGEAIIMSELCRQAVRSLGRASPARVAQRSIRTLIEPLGAEAGIIVVDSRGRIGFAHNADSMQIGIFDPRRGVHYISTEPIRSARGK